MEKDFGKDWKWPGIENYQLKYANVTKSRQGHEWLENRMKTALPWNDFLEKLKLHQVNGWPTNDYVLDDGTLVENIFDEDYLLSMKGRRFSRVKDKAESRFASVVFKRIF